MDVILFPQFRKSVFVVLFCGFVMSTFCWLRWRPGRAPAPTACLPLVGDGRFCAWAPAAAAGVDSLRSVSRRGCLEAWDAPPRR